MKTKTTPQSLPVLFCINDNQNTRNILDSNSSGSSSCLQSQLWLPLAVPPYFLVNAHHTALTLPSLSQCTLTIIHWKSHFLLRFDRIYTLPPSQRPLGTIWHDTGKVFLPFLNWLCLHLQHQSPNLDRFRLLPSNPRKKGHFHVC